jgi:glycosyltransferase involved in cell wall biosynthesis
MLQILHLVYPGMSGSKDVVFSLIEADKKKKLNHNILFVGPNLSNQDIKKSKKLDVKFSWVKNIKFIYFSSLFQVLCKINFFKPDLILIHNYYIISCVIYKIFNPKVKLFYINHKSISLLDWRDKQIKYFSNFFDKIIVLNKNSLDLINYLYKVPFKKISIIPNGVNTKFFIPKLNKKKFSFLRMGMACRVNKNKLYDLIANALNSNSLKNLNIKFSLAGIGEDLENFKARIKDMGLQEKIEFVGCLNQADLKKWLATLDLYIQASKGEGMSISLLSAMSSGVPVLASRVEGIKDFLCKKYLGILFNNNIPELAKKIKFFYFLNKKEKKKYSQIPRKYIISNFSYEKMFKNYFFEINQALNR